MAPSDPSNGGWSIIKTNIVLLVIDSAAILLRFISRSKVKASLGMDDLWALLAFILLLANVSMNFWAVFDGGVGYPAEELTPTQIVVSLQADWILTWLNFAMVLCVKLSVVFLYRRIFTTKGFRKVTSVFIVVIVLHLVILMLLAGFRCVPVVSNWDLTVKPTMCLSYSAAFLSGMTINAVIDACLLAMPFFMIRRLHMTLQKRFELAGIFALGAGTVIFSILRVTQAYSPDPVADNRVKLAIWSLVEPAVGLVCACLPTLRPLFPLLALGKVRTWYSHRKNSQPSSDGFSEGRPSASFGTQVSRQTPFCPQCPHCQLKHDLGNCKSVESGETLQQPETQTSIQNQTGPQASIDKEYQTQERGSYPLANQSIPFSQPQDHQLGHQVAITREPQTARKPVVTKSSSPALQVHKELPLQPDFGIEVKKAFGVIE